ncbi:MAG: DUF1273 domain-containing protein [Ruminococcaceae bacterium]|nr:DUF1273 domain-containing protein [Oscillospiraceae bacterium]
MFRVSFTGYRPAKLPFFGEDDPLCIALKQRIESTVSELAESGAREFFSGMALGVDIWCAEAVLKLKQKYSDIKLTAMIPCHDQDARWNEAERARYHDILSQCDKTICISPVYSKDCMHRRNRALVEICDVLVAVYDGKSGGTKYTVDHATKAGRRIITLSPV